MPEKFDPSLLQDCHQRALDEARQFMHEGHKLVVVSNTSTREWEFKKYVELADTYGYRVHSIVLENRHKGESVHNVPTKKFNEMRGRFEVVL